MSIPQTVLTGVHPLYIMFPATVATSMAFMLPVATPPNSLIFSYSNIKSSDMIKAGAVMNLFSVIVILTGVHTWGWYTFQLSTVPNWAKLLLNETTDRNSSLIATPWPLETTDIVSVLNQSSVSNYFS
ncbi:solute carrier family 13 member 2-like [Elysia marginata]|uniref:Solute carrier family 13 member 2-like n=1 Tax=Elysia marginata TaxID=1093978 RepID=A0AAV4GYP7_9GAST|nr:solute carrier family 13 member 2-like [Elysia marginata]